METESSISKIQEIASSRAEGLKVFNAAKKFAEEILFPLMADFRKYQRQASFGSADLNNSLVYEEDIREIQRFNGLKGMAETTQMLYNAISSTVLTNNRKEEVAKLFEMQNLISQVIRLFYDKREYFFLSTVENNRIKEKLNREYFEKIKEVIESIYINAEILMNKNRLLGLDFEESYLSDEEIREMIKKEYIEN